jgi:GT2 family glycosyltransferase
MNPVLITAYNNLSMTKAAVASALAQDVRQIQVKVINNGSTDGTKEWLNDQVDIYRRLSVHHLRENTPPTTVANDLLEEAFAQDGASHVLAIPNDVVIPKNLYSEFLKWPRGFVTASMTDTLPVTQPEEIKAVSENTPMAVVLVRKWAYQAIVAKDGYFLDERIFHYASDNDLALRMAACGIRGVQLNLNYYHYGSASWRTAESDDQRRMLEQADKDREYFEKRWGFKVSDPQYSECARDINFRG